MRPPASEIEPDSAGDWIATRPTGSPAGGASARSAGAVVPVAGVSGWSPMLCSASGTPDG